MDPKREEFSKYTTERLYGFSNGNNYEDYQIHGLYTKLGLRGSIRCYKHACKRDKNLIDLLDLAYEYTKINPQDKDSYAKESTLIENIDKYAIKAAESTKVSVDTIEETIEIKQKLKDSLSPDEQKKIDFECLLLREETINCHIAAIAIKQYYDQIIFGTLPSSEIPNDYFVDSDPSLPIGHPVFSHDPVGTDISEALRRDNPFFTGLANYAKDMPNEFVSIFSDCGGGIVCIKLWDLDAGQPVYIRVDKNDVFDEWIRDGGNTTLWPGLLCKALEKCGCSVNTDDPEKLFKIIFGPDTEVGSDYLSQFVPGSIENSQDIYAYEQYYRCLSDISLALLSTQSINQIDDPFMKLREAVKLVMGNVFDNLSSDIELLGPAMDFLKQKSDEYRNSKDMSRKRSRRNEICDSIDQLYTIYKNGYLKYTPIDVFESPTGRSLNRD